jgi:hypothetical protein
LGSWFNSPHMLLILSPIGGRPHHAGEELDAV